jgi:site-specific DNA-methyltransferase (adenine-specific)
LIEPYWQGEGITIYHGDCLDVMPELEGEIDAILADLPYGTTACKWDSIIPFEPLWENYKRLIKKNGAIVLTASQPFTSALVMSNPKWFRYCLVWDKCAPTGHLDANRKPLKRHEDICVFSDGNAKYNPQMETRGKPRWKGGTNTYETR